MNGMRYMLPKFSCPASANTDQITWDYAFLTKEEFIEKHGALAYSTMVKTFEE